jgi:hypothetical protein
MWRVSFRRYSKNEVREKTHMQFIKFLISMPGRILRIAIGVSLIGWGESSGEILLKLIGLFFVVEGAFDVVVLGPLFKLPTSGKLIREKLK